jgi:hypothetical protein
VKALLVVNLLAFGLVLALRPGSHGDVDAATTARFTNLQVDTLATFDGRIVEQACKVNFGTTLPGTTINDWSPPCLGTNTLVQITAADNTGTTLTGIDAVGKALPLGSVLTICNESSTADAGILALTSLDSASAVGNRILTPATGAQRTCSVALSPCQLDADCPVGQTCLPSTSPRYYIGPDQCTTLRLIAAGQPDDVSWPEWEVESPARIDYAPVQNLALFPDLFADPITSGAVLDDYNPTCTGALPCSEAGGNNVFQDYSMVFLSTTAAGGATINGFHYAFDIHTAAGILKQIVNLGPGLITIGNNASAFPNDNVNDGANGDPRGNIVLRPSSGVWLWHGPQQGGWIVLGKRDYLFSERDVSMTAGAYISGTDTNVGGETLFVDKTQDAGSTTLYVNDQHAYGAAAIHYGLTINQAGTGLASGQNRALQLAAGGTNPWALELDTGGIYLGFGAAMPFAYVNAAGTDGFDISAAGPTKIEGPLRVNGGAFTGEALTKICSPAVPTANHGTLFADSTNCVGEINTIGANTSVTLTFGAGGFAITSHCSVTVEGSATVGVEVSTVSATAPVFSCFTLATGLAANCPNFTYTCWGH